MKFLIASLRRESPLRGRVCTIVFGIGLSGCAATQGTDASTFDDDGGALPDLGLPDVGPSSDGGFHGCHWIDPGIGGVCDGFGGLYCANWGMDVTAGSDLVAYTNCLQLDGSTGATCGSWSVCNVFGCACGGQPPCSVGHVCGRRPGEREPSCVECLF